MAGAGFITHKGRKILHIDLSYSEFDEILEAIGQAAGLIRTEPAGSVLGLVDVSKSIFNKDVAQALKDFAAENEPFIKFSIAVGIDGIKAVIFNAIMVSTRRKNIITMDDVEKAKDFLAGML